MGNTSSDSSSAPPPLGDAISPPHQERRKRLAEEMLGGEQEVEEVSPRRKRIQSTSDYIYETLFKRGADSDITICALGEEEEEEEGCIGSVGNYAWERLSSIWIPEIVAGITHHTHITL